jgi:hypothetical protein
MTPASHNILPKRSTKGKKGKKVVVTGDFLSPTFQEYWQKS